MSGAIGAAAFGIGSQLVAAILAPTRKIGNITPGIVMEERATDTLRLTSHPVEQGSNISDHAYLEPKQVVIQARWSDASIGAITGAITSALSGNFADALGDATDGILGTQSYSQQQYTKVVALQQTLTPFAVLTGKRRYPTMMLLSIENVTDRHTEYCLALNLTCREVIIVKTASAQLPATTQANPQQTASPANTGTQTAAPANPDSILKTAGNALGVSNAGALISKLGGVF